MVMEMVWLHCGIIHSRINSDSMVSPDSAALLQQLNLKIRPNRILDMTVCLGLLSPALDAPNFGCYLLPGTPLHPPFTCPLVVIHITNLSATIVVSQASCLTASSLSSLQKTRGERQRKQQTEQSRRNERVWAGPAQPPCRVCRCLRRAWIGRPNILAVECWFGQA